MFAIYVEGEICNQQCIILKEQEKFYHELYTKDTSVQFNISNKTGIQLSVTKKEMLDQEVTFEEIHAALHSLKKNKVPGCDGLSIDFIVFFGTC